MKKKNNIYITTPIFYPNCIPHIGHLYTLLLADVFKKFQKQQGNNVFFLTGIDEHGEKILKTICMQKESRKSYMLKIIKEFKKIWTLFDIDYDFFIRTDNKIHKDSVQKILKIFYAKNLIYKGKYENNYCIHCEEFLTDNQLLKNKLCLNCNRKTKKNKEMAYFLKTKKFKKWILEYYNSDKINSKNIILELKKNFLNNDFTDLCISRKAILSDIKMPFDKKYTVYVWFDALINYISALGFFNNKKHKQKKFWESSKIFHIIGKEITRFHCIYWPIILKNLNFRQPTKFICHGWILNKKIKISKSKKNFKNILSLIDKYSILGIKYYIINFPINKDNSFIEKNISLKYNADIVNGYGNLISRFTAMIENYFQGSILKFTNNKILIKEEKINNIKKIYLNYIKNSEKFLFHKALLCSNNLVSETNKLLQINEPWKLYKNKNYNKLNILFKEIIFRIKILNLMFLPYFKNQCDEINNKMGFSKKRKNIFKTNKIIKTAFSKKIKKINNLFSKI